MYLLGFPAGSVVTNPSANAGGAGSVPVLCISPGEGNGKSFQYSCLGNPMHRGAWWAVVHGVAKESDNLVTEQQQFIVVTITLTKFFYCFLIYVLAYLSDIQSLYIFSFPFVIFHLLQTLALLLFRQNFSIFLLGLF